LLIACYAYGMKVSSLHRVGLTEDQILTYKCLLENGSLTPPQLASITEESRTSAYMSLKKMEELGLATRDASSKKLVYTVVSPARLEQLLNEQEEVIKSARTELQAQLPDLLSVFYSHAAKPDIRFFEGADTLELIYQDKLETNEDIYIVRSSIDKNYYSDKLYDYMNRLSAAGLTTHGLAPVKPSGGVWSKKFDKELRRSITLYDSKQYTAPVEISVYGNKVAFVTFGKTVSASVIDNQHIAQAMREMFAMAATDAATDEESVTARSNAKISKLSRVPSARSKSAVNGKKKK
jgi:sugar-specific transcriptional regulator TrmB